MTTTLPLTFWSTNWTLPNEGSVVTPLLLPRVAWIDADRAGIAGEFDRALRQGLIEKGMYSEALDYTPPETLEHERITVAFEAPARSQLFPDLQLEFDVWFGELPRGDVLCFVPVLGIEAWGETRESARVRGIEAIRLEFARRKRLKSVHAVLSTQWCRSIEMERTELGLRFFTLHELKEIEAGNVEKWLPRAAFRREGDSPRRVFELEEVLEGVARVLSR